MKNSNKSDVQSKQKVELETLVESFRAGDELAFERLIERTERACRSLARSILRDEELAKDAVQDAYFVVYRRIGQLRDASAFKSWLFTIVNRSCHDILRKRKHEVETELSEKDEPVATDNPPERVTETEAVRRTFHQLRDSDRECLALREVASLSYEEMSRVLAIPIGTVRSRLAKARKRFAKAYTKEQRNE